MLACVLLIEFRSPPIFKSLIAFYCCSVAGMIASRDFISPVNSSLTVGIEGMRKDVLRGSGGVRVLGNSELLIFLSFALILCSAFFSKAAGRRDQGGT